MRNSQNYINTECVEYFTMAKKVKNSKSFLRITPYGNVKLNFGALAGTQRRLSRHRPPYQKTKVIPINRGVSLRDAIARRMPVPSPHTNTISDIPRFIYASSGDPFAKHICKERRKRREVLFANASGAGHRNKIIKKNPAQFSEESYYIRCK